MSLTPGTRLGPYEIAAQIGVGGMGEVYRANGLEKSRGITALVMELVEGPTLEAAHERSVRDADRQARLRREDVAEGLSISRSMVTREWQTARAWMHRHRRLTDGRARRDS